MKKVSIISPCYNGEKYISKYLESVYLQSYPSIELIIIDDASTDMSRSIIEDYIAKFEEKGYSLVYKRQPINKGQAAALNVGLRIFTGEYVTWMDSDDIYCPNAIERKVTFLEENPHIEFVLNSGEIVYSSDLDKQIGLLKRVKPENDDLFKDLLDEHNVVFTPGSIMVRSSSLLKAIPALHIYESREGQNWQMLLPLSYTCRYGYIDEVLFKYVIHSDSHSHTQRSYEEEIQRRDNFYILQKNTIEAIPSMTSITKKEWIHYSYVRQLRAKYYIAIEHRKKEEYLKYKHELIDQGSTFRLTDNYFLYPIRKLASKIIRKVKRVLIHGMLCCIL